MIKLQFMIMIISMMFIMSNHPLMMGTLLIFQTITICLIMGMISQSFWFSYILFLVMIGGLLILFIYVISLIYNKIFFLKPSIYQYIKFMSFVLIFLYFNFLMLNKTFNFNNNETALITFSMKLNPNWNLIKLFNFPNNIMNLLMINYLFFLLIVVVKITNFYSGPLRMK